MKTINVIIIVLFAALASSAYLLATKLFPAAVPAVRETIKAETEKMTAPEPVPATQPRPQINNPAPTPQPSAIRVDSQAAQPAPPAPPVREEPKLRPVRDIKVVMYMTDW
ncbi:MAG TPA: hypothetical protein VMB78_06305 [Dissulfurispiraceae bacterium]|nr:hypothetical protein [Dissulfurispiraceae bacterium]